MTIDIGTWLNRACPTTANALDLRRDCQVLLAHVLKRDKSWLLCHPEWPLTPEIQLSLENSLEKLRQGCPLPYLIGEWEFYKHRFYISPQVLIPRPETETLIEEVLSWMDKNNTPRLVADIGTGSACIAITLALENPHLNLIASDISPAALSVAQSNIQRYSLQKRVNLLQADLLSAINNCDLIVANLPYIPTHILPDLAVTAYEPRLALDGGIDGLRLIDRLLDQSVDIISPGGLIALEIEAGQGTLAREFATRFYPNAKIKILPDLSGHDRLIIIETEKG